MPVNRKQQILAKVESSEGVDAAPGASDAVLVFDPTLSDEVEKVERVPAGPTLSRDFVPIGRKTRTIAFRSDFRGSGDTSIPITLPDWANLLFACGFAQGTIQAVVLGAVTGAGFMIGELVTQSSGTIRGVVVGIIQNTTNVPLHRTTATGDVLVVANLNGTFTAAATVGASSLSSSTVGPVAAYPGVCMQPTSAKTVTVTVASWTGTPPAVGDVIEVQAPAGITVGSAQILADNGSMLSMELSLLYGSMLATNTLRTAGGATATISTAVQNKTPSLTIRHNLDGRRRALLGARGDFTLEAEVGQPLQFAFNFSGDPGTAVDTPQVATTGLSTIKPPRFVGAVACYGFGSLQSRLPTKRVSINLGAQVNPNLDANREGGATGSNVTDRDPTITVTVDAVHGAFDWESLRDNSTPVRAAFVLGTTLGNVVALVAPVCQVYDVALGEDNGIATMEVTLKPKRVNESGDDELFFCQL